MMAPGGYYVKFCPRLGQKFQELWGVLQVRGGLHFWVLRPQRSEKRARAICAARRLMAHD